jgi:cell fate (sporulation/competence/biofilm development) regulator YlbF (YheA/YmcA/DUF963 family)
MLAEEDLKKAIEHEHEAELLTLEDEEMQQQQQTLQILGKKIRDEI